MSLRYLYNLQTVVRLHLFNGGIRMTAVTTPFALASSTKSPCSGQIRNGLNLLLSNAFIRRSRLCWPPPRISPKDEENRILRIDPILLVPVEIFDLANHHRGGELLKKQRIALTPHSSSLFRVSQEPLNGSTQTNMVLRWDQHPTDGV